MSWRDRSAAYLAFHFACLSGEAAVLELGCVAFRATVASQPPLGQAAVRCRTLRAFKAPALACSLSCLPWPPLPLPTLPLPLPSPPLPAPPLPSPPLQRDLLPLERPPRERCRLPARLPFLALANRLASSLARRSARCARNFAHASIFVLRTLSSPSPRCKWPTPR